MLFENAGSDGGRTLEDPTDLGRLLAALLNVERERLEVERLMAESLKRLADAHAPTLPETCGTRRVAKILGLNSTQRVVQMIEEEKIPADCIVPGSGNGRRWAFYTQKVERLAPKLSR